MNQILIRHFVQEDIEQIIEILQRIGWADKYIEGQKKAINKLIQDEEGEVLVAIYAEAVAGYIQVQHHQWNRLSHIHGLVVSIDYRRLGIARQLVSYVEQASQKKSNRGIYVDTPVDNVVGRSFYKSIGFAISYIMPEFYDMALDGVTYIKLFQNNENASAVLRKTNIRSAVYTDIPAMVSLSYAKRRAYEKAQALFWRYAENANAVQAKWFSELLDQKDYILLIAEIDNEIIGFIIGRLVPAPEVYDPGGLTLMIDDFCVKKEEHWNSVGKELVGHIKIVAKAKGAVQILVVCGYHDQPKRQFLQNMGLTVASEWYVGENV